ncbi:MAG: GNAT family N-acetyltransferase [Anaerolineae bacterium]|nr:GNAT family N-acetyltransferase [Anaerolineae bacterium]
MDIQYRLIDRPDEFEKVVDLEIEVWGLEPRDAVPGNLFRSLAHNGAVVIGAFDTTRLVGMVFGFPTSKPTALWSHMAGVHPDYQGMGIGFQLKQQQREWALANGYKTMGWTFDPMQRGNAKFNIDQIGAVSQVYHVDYYGPMRDTINAGLASDRLEVLWDFRKKPKPAPRSEGPFLVEMHDSNLRHSQVDLSQATYNVEIPYELKTLKSIDIVKAQAWQLAVREALCDAFNRGYRVEGFAARDGRCWYILQQQPAWYLYVVTCADQSLYTGITNNLERRIQQHNRGKGAAYTASHRPVHLIGAWQFQDKSQALKAELKFKKLTRQNKLNHLKQKSNYLEGTFLENE